MSLTQDQIDALNELAETQPSLRPFLLVLGLTGLGDLIDDIDTRLDSQEALPHFAFKTTQTLTSVESTVTFNDIPQTATNLQIHWQVRGTRNAVSDQMRMRFNNDSSTIYSTVQYTLEADDTIGASGGDGFSANGIFVGLPTAATGTANSAGHGVIEIPNYTGTTFHKGAKAKSFSAHNSATANIRTVENGGEWRDTSAITRIDFVLDTASFDIGSTFTLYGY